MLYATSDLHGYPLAALTTWMSNGAEPTLAALRQLRPRIRRR